MSRPSITVETMRPKLLSLDTVRATLAATEPLSTVEFALGDQIHFEVEPGWQHGIDTRQDNDPVEAVARIGGHDFPLTKAALLEAGSVCGLPKAYTARLPAELLAPQLNHWFQRGLAERRGATRDYQLLVAAGLGSALTRASVTPFSNLRLLDEAEAGIRDAYGTDAEILVDYKFTHSLKRTHLRLIVPGHQRTITGTGTAEDIWSVGLQVVNSLTGDAKTAIEGYLFRWWCTNGATDTAASSGSWTRRSNGTDADVYEWARGAVDAVLGGLEPALDAVQALTEIPVDGSVTDVLRDVFTHYRIPVSDRTRITNNIIDAEGPLTMYSVMAAVTEAANGLTEPAHIDNLLRVGGDLAHTATGRCGQCRRLMPH